MDWLTTRIGSVGRLVAMILLLAVTVFVIVLVTSSGDVRAGFSDDVTGTTTSTDPSQAPTSLGPNNAPPIAVPGGIPPGRRALVALTCPSTAMCMAAGQDSDGTGIVASSVNSGATWTPSATPGGTGALAAIACADSIHCSAVGQDSAVFSADGGQTWTSASLPSGDGTWSSIVCPSPTLCLAGGEEPQLYGPASGSILVSTDAGATWKEAGLPPDTHAVASIACVTTTRCLAVGAELLVSSDAGSTWQPSQANGGLSGALQSVACTSTTHCLAVGPNGQGIQDPNAGALELITDDAGDTWSTVSTPAGSAAVWNVYCHLGLICTASGATLRAGGAVAYYQSTDEGVTWTPSQAPAMSAVTSVVCPDQTICIALGESADGPASATSANLGTWMLNLVSQPGSGATPTTTVAPTPTTTVGPTPPTTDLAVP